MNRFDGKNVLLTGAASGIGRATAVRLLAEGATVFAVDRDEDGLEETGKLAGTDRFVPYQADLAREEAVVPAAAAAVARLGRVDVLANVAGVLRVTPMESVRLDDYRDIFAVNVFAPVMLCREVLPHIPDRTGVIVNVTSTAATKAHPWMTGYAASKGALLSFSISLAAELASRRIRVVPVSPGGVATPLTANRETFAGVDTSWYARTYPLWGRPGRPEDVAGTIAYVASADGAYLNGVEVRVDGGSHS
ncbi:SDR family NAD(P)-dependent oxidoreductase [Microbispora sp. H10830]|uniref:SDR family NAD(P)-dependent oxidoreductase n=1 Tax=Microbispora sp. H10830 TaxID=2729109 RepID=UPI00160182F2|nr:SDR family oxidoreductase [Microbispora sp. H10830]